MRSEPGSLDSNVLVETPFNREATKHPASGQTAQKAIVVGIAASAGGLAALERVLEGLPRHFPAPIVVVQHLDPTHESMLPQILARHTRLSVTSAKNHERVEDGHVYVAPPNHHVTIDGQRRISLSSEPLVHFVRPSADVLFASLAMEYGSSAIVIVLPGTGADGAAGAALIKKSGGKVMVENPRTAAFPGMPAATLAACDADYVVDLDNVAKRLCEMIGVQ
jgi:two-component system chemotaxis response regulator CheB